MKPKFIILIITVFLLSLILPFARGSSENIKSSQITNFKSVEKASTKTDYTDFIKSMNSNKIKNVYIEFTNRDYGNTFFYTLKDDKKIYYTDNPQYKNFKKDLLLKSIKILPKSKVFKITTIRPQGSVDITDGIMLIVNLVFMFYIFMMIKSLVPNNSKTIYKIDPDEKTLDLTKKKELTFSDIGGLHELKEDLISVVDFIKNPDKYHQSDAKLPKGILLVGPPGTGKTLLAKVIAKEANVPFLYMSGSDFVEMYVGRGAARVRELFKEARKNAPCIIFIDEIDTLCGKRGYENNSHSEDRKTLTALLAEMDGFKESTNILVIGATNRLEDIDDAALRPGRFTEIFHVPIPETVNERLEIIDIYSKNKKFSEDVDLKEFAHEMIGRSPAEIEAVLNESAIISVQQNLPYINKKCLELAFYKRIMQGHQKSSKDTNELDLKCIAYHEAAHALVAKLHNQSVTKVTIAPSTSGAGGVTFTQPSDRKLYSKSMLIDEVKKLYAGKVGEYILYDKNWNDTTGGCSNDIERATMILKEMAEEYGMSDTGLVNMKVLSKDTAKETNKFVLEMSNKLLQETISEVESNRDKLDRIANALLANETIYESTLDEIINETDSSELNKD